MQRSESVKILLGVVYDEFEGTYLVVTVGLVIADATNNALLKALWLKTDQVEDFSCVEVSFGALWVVKLV